MKPLSESEKAAIYDAFRHNVNLSIHELTTWLNTNESQSVGIVSGTTRVKKTLDEERESIGHASGRRIIEILKTDKHLLDEDDYRHMKKVNGYIRRHQVQVPEKSDLSTSRWRYSLMNWGHDPLNSPTRSDNI